MNESIATLVICLIIGFLVVVFAEKLFKSYNLRKVDKIVSNIKAGKSDDISLENSKYGTIEIFEEGFQIKSTANPESTYIAWSDISEILTYKKDLVTTDLICLGWKTYEDALIEVHEEMLGFKKLCESMLNKFKGISASWYMDVAHPAFETKLTILWSKK